MAGCRVERLIGFGDQSELPRSPVVVSLKAHGQEWQRFFLDVGFGVWEEWLEEALFEDHSELSVCEYGQLFELKGKTIEFARCSHVGINGVAITLGFSSGERFAIQCPDSSNLECDAEVVFQVGPIKRESSGYTCDSDVIRDEVSSRFANHTE